MRMRKKRNLDGKLTACTNLIDTVPVTKDYREEIKEKNYIDFDGLFPKTQPLELEIGCGKGTFVCEMAKRHPEINFVAVEVERNVIMMACRKAMDEKLDNVLFLHCKAEVLQKYVKPGTFSRLYLNFSCPFPKKRQENRRLTYLSFLEIYRDILTPEAQIHQKTDNMHFFEFSLEQFSLAGCKLQNISLDLHNSGMEDNIVTEYEQKFTALGYPIYRVEAYWT